MHFKIIFSLVMCVSLSLNLKAQTIRFNDGNRIQSVPSGNYYYVLDGIPRPISDSLIKSDIFLKYYMILSIPDAYLLFANMNKPIESMRLIKTYNDSIFLLVDEQRRHISSPEAGEMYQFNLSSYTVISNEEMQKTPKGETLIFVEPKDMPPPCGVDDNKRD
jgi:hypothetical protein